MHTGIVKLLFSHIFSVDLSLFFLLFYLQPALRPADFIPPVMFLCFMFQIGSNIKAKMQQFVEERTEVNMVNSSSVCVVVHCSFFNH